MKKLILTFGGTLASFALMITAMNVNTACMYGMHQPKLPAGAQKLKKR